MVIISEQSNRQLFDVCYIHISYAIIIYTCYYIYTMIKDYVAQIDFVYMSLRSFNRLFVSNQYMLDIMLGLSHGFHCISSRKREGYVNKVILILVNKTLKGQHNSIYNVSHRLDTIGNGSLFQFFIPPQLPLRASRSDITTLTKISATSNPGIKFSKVS